MIDIHHHLLYGLDDGSSDLDNSVRMAEAAIADGITHIACTPHANDTYEYRPEVNRERLAEIESRLDGRITLGLGCDFHLSYDNIADALRNPARYTLNGKRYLLVEFPDLGIAPNISETFYQLELIQVTPIITHPERNPTITRRPELLAEWIRGGCLVQVTASSLTGRFGKIAEKFSHELLRKNWVHFLATDAHNLSSRPPLLSEAYRHVANRYGAETAERLCVGNPRAAFYGEPWPEQPEPEELYEGDAQNKPARGGLFGRLFDR